MTFAPTAPTEYNAALNTKLEGGTAGDLITCRPFDPSLGLFNRGYLASLNDLPGMENFGDVAKSAWITDDGKTAFCVPMASVIHGFIYNKDVFDKLGLTPPTTDRRVPRRPGRDQEGRQLHRRWRWAPRTSGKSATMGFQNIGPNYWKGEDGRKALIAGTAEVHRRRPMSIPVKELASWKPYMATGSEAQKYPDAQSMFTLGQAAIYPAGSWDIATFESRPSSRSAPSGRPSPKAGDTVLHQRPHRHRAWA